METSGTLSTRSTWLAWSLEGMKVDNIKPEKIVSSFLLVTVHKTMSKELDEIVAKFHFLALFSRRAGVRDDSGMSHLMSAQFG